MADLLKNVFGGSNQEAPAGADSDFADFAGAPDPVPEAAAVPNAAKVGGSGAQPTAVPYTKWYNVHERHSLSEFKAEGIILLMAAAILVFHMIGARANRSKAKKWIRAHAPVLTGEFASVGFSGIATMGSNVEPDTLLKENSLFEFATYATGRQNTAFMDIKLTLTKKFNPVVNAVETAFAFFMESANMPIDTVDATIYTFDGKESLTVPSLPVAADTRSKDVKSTYDGFVWAIVNKERMQKMRDQRYDVSLTVTKDHPNLPIWMTVMSENAEITSAMLTPELIDAVKKAGDAFDYLIVTDQPTDKPTTLEETEPRKRVILKYRMPSNNNYDSLLPLFNYYLRLPDFLVQTAHFRTEVTKKLQKTRDQMNAQLQKAADDLKNEERAQEKEKQRKLKRDAELSALDAKAQKKYLEKEREKEMRKSQKKQTMRG